MKNLQDIYNIICFKKNKEKIHLLDIFFFYHRAVDENFAEYEMIFNIAFKKASREISLSGKGGEP